MNLKTGLSLFYFPGCNPYFISVFCCCLFFYQKNFKFSNKTFAGLIHCNSMQYTNFALLESWDENLNDEKKCKKFYKNK